MGRERFIPDSYTEVQGLPKRPTTAQLEAKITELIEVVNDLSKFFNNTDG